MKLDDIEKKYTEADLDRLLQFVIDEEAHGQSPNMLIWDTTRAKVLHFFKEYVKDSREVNVHTKYSKCV